MTSFCTFATIVFSPSGILTFPRTLKSSNLTLGNEFQPHELNWFADDVDPEKQVCPHTQTPLACKSACAKKYVTRFWLTTFFDLRTKPAIRFVTDEMACVAKALLSRTPPLTAQHRPNALCHGRSDTVAGWSQANASKAVADNRLQWRPTRWSTPSGMASVLALQVGPADDRVANVLVAQRLFLESENPDKDIHLYINFPGGLVTVRMAIDDTMQSNWSVHHVCWTGGQYGCVVARGGPWTSAPVCRIRAG